MTFRISKAILPGLLFGAVALSPALTSAWAADVEIGRDGVDVETDRDYHHEADDYQHDHDRYEHESYDRHDRYDHDRHDEDVNIDVPGADIHID